MWWKLKWDLWNPQVGIDGYYQLSRKFSKISTEKDNWNLSTFKSITILGENSFVSLRRRIDQSWVNMPFQSSKIVNANAVDWMTEARSLSLMDWEAGTSNIKTPTHLFWGRLFWLEDSGLFPVFMGTYLNCVCMRRFISYVKFFSCLQRCALLFSHMADMKIGGILFIVFPTCVINTHQGLVL